MELFIIILLSAIFAETSALTVRDIVRKHAPVKNARRKLFVDTSTLMDGRILSVAKAGFLGDEVLIPRSVIRELQLLADGSDSEKRTRARFGLDVVNELERVELASVEIFPDEGDRVKVDERLLELAKMHHGIILTNDFNLAKVAAAEHIDAININDLAQGLRSEYLPGDKLDVKITAVGANPHQGVAHLSDGTMVVVDDAERYAGKNQTVTIEFVRYLQTAAGKMMFAKLATPKVAKRQNKKSTTHRRTNK
ncbi:TRAM domain-containing protein [Candidatus Saccharibacteria bacterium]|nr:TRAM domain-containing protein [Candidatus Saccharibacteria bacterium]